MNYLPPLKLFSPDLSPYLKRWKVASPWWQTVIFTLLYRLNRVLHLSKIQILKII